MAKKTENYLVDFALLTCGMVDVPVFTDCVNSINREIKILSDNEKKSRLHVIMNGVEKERRQTFRSIAETVDDVNIIHSERVGFSAGANRVIRQGNAPLVIFITDDVVYHEGAALKLVNRMNDAEIGICGLKLLFPKTSTDSTRPAGRVQHIGHAFDANGECIHPLIGWKPENQKCNISRDVQSVTGASFIVRRYLFNRVRGFYEGYGLGYFEDVDLCFAIRSLGVRAFIETEAVADHYTNASMRKSDKPIPMNENKALFRSRWGRFVIPDSFTFW